MKRTIGVLVLLAVLTGCGEDGPPEVDWSTYAPQVKANIDSAGQVKNCGVLDRQMSDAIDSNDAHRAKHGEGNSDLFAYIDWRKEQAGCP